MEVWKYGALEARCWHSDVKAWRNGELVCRRWETTVLDAYPELIA